MFLRMLILIFMLNRVVLVSCVALCLSLFFCSSLTTFETVVECFEYVTFVVDLDFVYASLDPGNKADSRRRFL